MLTLSLLAAPLAAEAPSPRKVHRIGFLWNSSPSLTHHLLEAFRHGLSERGYVEGEHFTIESRYAEGNPALLPGLAAEVVGLQVEVIVTSGAQAVQAVRQATNTIPVVMVAIGAPVEAGFVTSLARPGGNLDGPQPHGPRVKRETAGTAQRNRASALPGGGAGEPGESRHRCGAAETQRAAQALQVQLHLVEVRGPQELDAAFSALRSLGG